jgi:hypothetical protein
MRPVRWVLVPSILAVALLGAPAIGLATDPARRPSAQAACAAFDLHLLMEVEEAAEAMEPQSLLAAVEAILAARRACRRGDLSEALRTYQADDLASTTTRWLR